jgi:hypothetical protein
VQRQLAASSLFDVALRPYFTQLCPSLGASMIGDHGRLSIDVTIDDSVASADAFGEGLSLIKTELVIPQKCFSSPSQRPDNSRFPDTWATMDLVGDRRGVGIPAETTKAKRCVEGASRKRLPDDYMPKLRLRCQTRNGSLLL